jgi:serine/threonine protein kinase
MSPQARDLAIGEKVGGDYLVESWIGAGGMGNVYRVKHSILDSEYALKTLSPDKISESGWLRFKNEAQAIARLNHKNVVGIYNLGLHEGRLPYYVMDLLKGKSLHDELRAKGPLPMEQALLIFKEVAEGIGHAHKKGIVHRDIKPANVMLLDDAAVGGARVKIVDFGIVKLSAAGAEAQQLTNIGEIFGSPYYMSPEQCQGGKVDARSDIYSLGCTIYECLTGVPPYRGHSAIETMLMHQNDALPTLQKAARGKEFPKAIENIVAKMIAKAPINRYQSMDKVVEDLSAMLAGQPLPLSPLPGAAQQSLAEKQGDSLENRRLNLQEQQTAKKSRDTAIKLSVAAVALTITAVGFILSLSEKPSKKPATSSANSSSTVAPPAVPPTAASSTSVDEPIKISRDAHGNLHCFFPEGYSLGRVIVAEHTDRKNSIGSQEEFNCQGEQTLPWGKKLGFYPTVACAGSKVKMQSLAAAHFHSCTLPEMDKARKHEATTALIFMRPWRGLERLDTTNYSALSADDLMLIKNYPDLNQLLIQNNEVDCKTLIATKLLARLNTLTLTVPENSQYFDSGNIVHVLELLAKTGKIEDLNLSGHRILPQDLNVITSMPRLRKLTIDSSGADSIECQVLARLDRLEQFSARNCLLDSLAIPYFQELAKKSLKTLDLRSTVFTPEVRRQYHEAMPKVTLL